MNLFGENEKGVSQLNNNHYKHTILVSSSALSKIELFTLTALSICLCFGLIRNDINVGNSLKIIGVSLYVLILAKLLTRIFFGVKLESIFVVKALGLQTTTVYNSSFKSSKFIPWHSINDVVINEAIVMQKVIFYLAVLVKGHGSKGGESIIPVFIFYIYMQTSFFKYEYYKPRSHLIDENLQSCLKLKITQYKPVLLKLSKEIQAHRLH